MKLSDAIKQFRDRITKEMGYRHWPTDTTYGFAKADKWFDEAFNGVEPTIENVSIELKNLYPDCLTMITFESRPNSETTVEVFIYSPSKNEGTTQVFSSLRGVLEQVQQWQEEQV